MPRKIKLCKEESCHNQQTTEGYCRLHYLKNWKKIRTDKKKKAEKNLSRYIESVVRQNPDRVAQALKDNLRDEPTFEKSVDEVFYNDSVREAIVDLGYREDLDTLIGSIKIDEDF